jgi:nicotinate-nucleotide adenylyltransferase
MPISVPRLGIYGGTFDPVHEAHVALMREAVRCLNLKRLHVVPTRPWQKSSFSPEADRLAMLRLRLAKEPSVMIDDRELKRDHPSYSIETLKSFREEFPDDALFFILGADQWRNITTWIDWQEFLTYANIAIFPRGTEPLGNPYPNTELRTLPASQPFPKNGAVLVIPSSLPAISSTEIRAQAAAYRNPIAGVAPEVLEYIRTRGLYETAAR